MAGFFDFLGNVLTSPVTLSVIRGAVDFGGRVNLSQQQAAFGANLQAAAEFTAVQLEKQASDAMASAQRRAWNEDRATKYLASETLARAAASGGGASDPTVINIIARQAEEGAYRQQVALYEGASRDQVLRLQAMAKRFEGGSQRAAKEGEARGTMFGAGTNLLKSMEAGSSLYKRFGGGGPEGVSSGLDLSPWARDGEGDY
jgi:hypothetical protein